jgi:hypothetical protein
MAGISKIWEPCNRCAPEFEQQTLIIKELADDSVEYVRKTSLEIVTLKVQVDELEDVARLADLTKLRFGRLRQSLLKRGIKIAALKKANVKLHERVALLESEKRELAHQVHILRTDVRVRDRRLLAMSTCDGLVQVDTGGGR